MFWSLKIYAVLKIPSVFQFLIDASDHLFTSPATNASIRDRMLYLRFVNDLLFWSWAKRLQLVCYLSQMDRLVRNSSLSSLL